MGAEPRGRLTWYVAADGYELGSPASEVLLGREPAVRAVKRRGDEQVTYRPEDIPDLYLRFVEIPESEEAARDFVTRYGFLGTNAPREWDERLQQWRSRPEMTVWESVESIQEHRTVLEHLVDYMEQCFWDESGAGEPGDSEAPRLHLAEYFTRQAPASFSIQVQPVERGGGKLGVSLEPAPSTLLATMWLQIAGAIQTGILWRSCEICGTTFQVGPGAGRMDKRVCSGRCQQARHRQQRRQRGEAQE